MIYLACPYSHEDPQIMLERFARVNAVAAKLMLEGHHVFSPISHSHPIAMAGELPTGWEFWESYDRQMISHCEKLIVLCLPGWSVSRGVSAEIAIAQELNIPVDYLYV